MIKFPNTFTLETGEPYLFFKSGLEDISESSPLQITALGLGTDILISNYKPTLPNQIII